MPYKFPIDSLRNRYDRLERYLDLDGDGTGAKVVVGNYGAGEEIIYIQPPAANIFYLSHMDIYIEDAGDLDVQKYGFIAALTTGIAVRTKDSTGVLHDMTDGLLIKRNGDWMRNCGNAQWSAVGSGNTALVVRWNFESEGPNTGIQLDGAVAGRLEVVLNDDFTGLIDHAFRIQGYIL